jgi:hypothetical protein
MYISVGTTRYVVNFLGYITDDVTLGQSASGSYQCCWTDPVGCVGYKSTCETASGGQIPCVCTATKTWSVTANSCTAESVPVCN